MKLLHAADPAPITQDPFQELAYGVIKRAVEDYRSLGKKLNDCKDCLEEERIEESMKSISRFFFSDWYSLLSGCDNGSEILEALDREVFGDG